MWWVRVAVCLLITYKQLLDEDTIEGVCNVRVFENAHCCPFYTTSGLCGSQHLRWGEEDELLGKDSTITIRPAKNVNINCQGFGEFADEMVSVVLL